MTASESNLRDQPLLPKRYPLAQEGLDFLAQLLGMSANDRAALFRSLAAKEIAHVFLIATEVRTMIEQIVRPALNEETQNRFLVHGDKSVEKALRAHARELPEQHAAIADIREHTEALASAPAWRRDLEKAHAEFEKALHGVHTEQKSLEEMRQAHQLEQREMEKVAADYMHRQRGRVDPKLLDAMKRTASKFAAKPEPTDED